MMKVNAILQCLQQLQSDMKLSELSIGDKRLILLCFTIHH